MLYCLIKNCVSRLKSMRRESLSINAQFIWHSPPPSKKYRKKNKKVNGLCRNFKMAWKLMMCLNVCQHTFGIFQTADLWRISACAESSWVQNKRVDIFWYFLSNLQPLKHPSTLGMVPKWGTKVPASLVLTWKHPILGANACKIFSPICIDLYFQRTAVMGLVQQTSNGLTQSARERVGIGGA